MKRSILSLRMMIGMVLVAWLLAACGTPTAAPPPPTPTPTPVPPTDTPAPPSPTPEPSTPTPEPTATPIPPTPVPSFTEKDFIHDLEYVIRCVGEGSPTIVMDSGLGIGQDEWSNVLSKHPEAMGVRVCIYDRPGRAPNSAGSRQPRTNQEMADDLHTLLVDVEIPGPYILVAHSMAGFTARLFQASYPEEVVGMVLIDSVTVDQNTRMLTIIPPESAGEDRAITSLRTETITMIESPKKTLEYWDMSTSTEQVRALGTLGDLPLVVLTRDVINNEAQLNLMVTNYGGNFPKTLLDKLDEDWLALQKELAELSTSSTHIIVEGSSHLIPWSQPESVVDAIRIVLEEIGP